jgi:hypothetical protein
MNPTNDIRLIAEQLKITPNAVEKLMRNFAIGHVQELATNPIAMLVYPSTLKEFTDAIGPAAIVATKGRTLHARRKFGVFAPFAELARDLLGTGKPCDQFTVNGEDLYARLKTISQVCADNAAIGYDDNYLGIDHIIGQPSLGEMITDCFGNLAWADHQGSAPERKDPARIDARRKKKIPEGASAIVMKAMKRLSPLGAIETDRLVAEAVKLMPLRKDKRNQDRRPDYATRGIQKLVGLELLYVHGDEQNQLSLTPIVVGGEA